MTGRSIISADFNSDNWPTGHCFSTDLYSRNVNCKIFPPKRLREIRTLIKHRVAIVKIRTMVKNEVHALIHPFAHRLMVLVLRLKMMLQISTWPLRV